MLSPFDGMTARLSHGPDPELNVCFSNLPFESISDVSTCSAIPVDTPAARIKDGPRSGEDPYEILAVLGNLGVQSAKTVADLYYDYFGENLMGSDYYQLIQDSSPEFWAQNNWGSYSEALQTAVLNLSKTYGEYWAPVLARRFKLV